MKTIKGFVKKYWITVLIFAGLVLLYYYVTDLFGFQKYRAQIWNKFSGQFEEKFEALEHLYEESADIVRDDYISQDQEDLDDTDQQTQWKNDFLRNAPCHNLKL